MSKKNDKWKIILAIVTYAILLLADLGFNLLAILIPSLGGFAESITELVIEITSGLIVMYLAWIGFKG